MAENNQYIEVRLVAYRSDEYTLLNALRDEVLRIPIGLRLTPDDIAREQEDIFIGAFAENDKIVGCCILTKTDIPYVIQLRQMAVDARKRKTGIGAELLKYAEMWTGKNKYRKIVLHARKTAVSFYKKNGYNILDNEFIEVGIPHFTMEKNILVQS